MERGAQSYRRFRETGDETALAEIITDYKDGLIFFLTGLLGDVRAAEETAMDTFVLLGVKKPRDSGKAAFRTWLYTIGRRLAIDRLRREKRRRELPLEDAALAAAEDALEESYIREERKIAVHRALRRLHPDYRQALWLTYFEGFSNKETAAVMHKSVHAVETLLSRARAALRKELETEGITHENV